MKRIKQENIKDCGVACLLSIIKYYGGNNTMENLRYLTKCDKNGVTAFNLIEASKKLGFDSCGIKCEFRYLIDNFNPPFIAHTIINKQYKHYVVVEKIDTKHKTITVNDSAFGLKKYKYNDFNNIWTNVIITLYPIRKLDNIKNNNMIRFYLYIINKYKIYIFFIMFLSLLSILLSIINTYYFKILIDGHYNLYKIYIMFILLIIIKCLLDLFLNKLIFKIDKRADNVITTSVYNKLLSLPNYYFNSRQTGDIMNRVNDLSYVKNLIIKIPIIIFTDLFLVSISTILLFYINKTLSLIFIIFIFMYILVVFIFNNKNKRYIRNIKEDSSIVNSHIKESISGIYSVKNLCGEEYLNNRFKYKYEKLNDNKYKYEKHYNIENTLKNLILLIAINTILFIGFMNVNNKIMTLGELILFNSLILYFFEPLKDMFDLEDEIRNGIGSIRRVSEILDINQSNGNHIENNINRININNLKFSYNNTDYILNNINLDIKEKDKISVIGSSGCGKSTLFKILTRQYEIDNNIIFINNVDINNWNIKNLRENICYISQEEKLFTDTLINNITFGKDINMNRVNELCKLTYVDEIMKNKNITFDSLIEEEGINFSVGEKQRIILLRCLLRNNNVLILDESLNGLDLYLERKILKNLIKLYSNRILIYITHRLDNVNLFHKTIDLEKERRNNDRIK